MLFLTIVVMEILRTLSMKPSLMLPVNAGNVRRNVGDVKKAFYEAHLTGADIYIVRLRQVSNIGMDESVRLGMSKPCKHCIRLLKDVGIKRVYYSDEGSFVCEKISEIQTTHVSRGNR